MVNQMVISSEIEWIGYEQQRQMLQIEYISGGIYQYDKVPEGVYHELLEAPSHCDFLDSRIKGRYPLRKVR